MNDDGRISTIAEPLSRPAPPAKSIRVLSYPDSHRNPYFWQFYRALEPYGVSVAYTPQVTDRMLGPDRKFDVLHFHWGLEQIWRWRTRGALWEAVGLGGWARFLRLARRNGVRLVWTAHEVMPPEGARWFDVLGYAMCAHAADLCICHSSQARDMLVRRFRVPPGKVVTMPIGTYFGTVPAPAGRDTTLREFGVPPDSRMLVCFGDLRPRKGVDVAAAAAGRLGRPYHLIVAGAPPAKRLEPWVHEVARTCAAAPNVTVRIERIDDQLLSTLVGTADCVLLPYRSILGSSALSLCLALGRAVVASDLPYFREVLSLDPGAGVLTKPGDPWALARGIEEFFSEPIAERHGAARRIGERLAWERIIAPVGERFQALAP